MSCRVRDLIRAVRACKTAAEERAVIAKEGALIRTAIKEEHEQFRARNVAKLLYMHMLGYPTHFGQMECLKLVAAPGFMEKRIGYLGLVLLLNEQAEVLTLVTNSLKQDLYSSTPFIVALSLSTIGNMASEDMARDLVNDVEQHLRGPLSYLRKKAALAMIRIFTKCPELVEDYSDRVVALLKDRSHGVLLTGVQLITCIVQKDDAHKQHFTRLVPSLVRLLRNLISMGYSPEHDVAGITDPFLQVALLRLLRVLGAGNEEASDAMNDVLAQVATNTETAKNAGNSVLYECVQTIMAVESESGLRVLAVNILGRFLLNRDNNIRYVALNTLAKVVDEDAHAVQRHRSTIVDCLKDPDVSIRQRAVDLILQLVNESNVERLITELLNYVIVAPADQKASLSSKILLVVERYSISDKWRIDTLLMLLAVAGEHCDEIIPQTTIMYIAHAPNLQGYAVHRLYRMITEDTSQIGLVHVAIWCVGEYGDCLLQPCPAPDSDGQVLDAFAADPILDCMEGCLKIHNATEITRGYVLNALAKLSTRFGAQSAERIRELLNVYAGSMAVELQQRSTEYATIVSGQWENVRANALTRMPVIDLAKVRARRADMSDFDDDDGPAGAGRADDSQIRDAGSATSTNGHTNGGNFGGSGSGVDTLDAALAGGPTAESGATGGGGGGGGGDLLDLDEIFGGGSGDSSSGGLSSGLGGDHTAPAMPPAVPPASSAAVAVPAAAASDADLLASIFDGSTASAAASMPSTEVEFPPAAVGAGAGTTLDGGLLQPVGTAVAATAAGVTAPTQAPLVPSVAAGVGSSAAGADVSILAAQTLAVPTMQVFEKNGLSIVFELSKPNASDAQTTQILCRFKNSSATEITGFLFQAAVPKYLKMELQPASNTVLPPRNSDMVTQVIKLTNTMHGTKPLMMKIKVQYTQNGAQVNDMAQVASFPPNF